LAGFDWDMEEAIRNVLNDERLKLEAVRLVSTATPIIGGILTPVGITYLRHRQEIRQQAKKVGAEKREERLAELNIG